MAVDDTTSAKYAPVVRLDDVLAEVMGRTAGSGIHIIGVDGPQGSSKSTLVARISARIGAPLVQMDDFVSWVDLVGWWPRFEAQVLKPLLSGSDAHYQVRDWENDEFGTSLNGWKTLEWSPIVVLEGLTCTRAAIADRLAYRIWVEAPDEVRLKHGLERDGGNSSRPLAGIDDHRAPVLHRRRNQDKG